MTTSVPSVEEVSTRLGQDPEVVGPVLDSERADQAARCRVVPYAAPLAEALHRRVQRSLALRNVPLGVLTDETGGTRVGGTDPEVRRLEAPYRLVVLG